jgi:hypothetical protein
MSTKALKSLDELYEESEAYLKRYSALGTQSPNDPSCSEFVDELKQWLDGCVALGRFLATGSPERRALRAFVDEWDSRLQRDGHHVEGLGRLADFDPTAGVVLDSECPYPGLEAYRADRAHMFHGRSDMARRLARHLVEQKIFLILGASGSGKSSLALAGIRPLLQKQYPDWLYPDDFAPGSAPLSALAAAVAAKAGRPQDAEQLARSLLRQPAAAADQFAALCGGRPLMLVIDQFEELITLCRDTRAQAAFATALVSLAERAGRSDGWTCHTLMTLRTDHLARFESSDALKPLYMRLVHDHNSELLTTLSFDDIKRAIVEPAKAYGLRFSPPSIVDALASQTAGLANGLPLLQFALRRLWDTRPTDKETGKPLDIITQAMVDTLPDVQRALGKVAEDIYAGLTERQQQICERAVQELVLLDENFEAPLRRRRNRAELRRVLTSRFPGAQSDVEEVERRFTAAGLLRIFGSGDDVQIEVTHEALLRHWKRLSDAVGGEEAKRRLHAVKQIGREAIEWEAHGRRNDFLKQQGAPLEAVRQYVDEGWLADAESIAYVQACEKRDKVVRDAFKTRTQLWWVATLGAVVAVVLGWWLHLAGVQRDANLSAIASDAERLPPWEGLDVVYNVAKSGGADYRFALARALERMEDAWLLGPRDAALFPVGDGGALLQFQRSEAKDALRIYLVADDGNPDKDAISVVLPSGGERFAQAQVGPAIQSGVHKGKHLLVLASLPSAERRSYGITAHVLDPTRDAATALDVSVAAAPAPSTDRISWIRIHPDGNRAIWSVLDYGTLRSSIFELVLDDQGATVIRPVDDPVVEPTGTTARPSNPATAVAYDVAYGGKPITGRLDGSLYCGSRKIETAAPSASPIDNIVTRSGGDVFAANSFSGRVIVGSCTGKAHVLSLPSSDPGSLRLTPVRQATAESSWVVSFLDPARQLRCFGLDARARNNPRWWICNAAHVIGSPVAITEEGQQLVVERSDIAAVRRFPNEELSRNERQIHARHAGDATLRWASVVSAGGELDRGADSPWQTTPRGIESRERRRIEAAALSPNGQRIVWIERLQTVDHRDVVPSDADPTRQRTVALVRSMPANGSKIDDWMKPQDGFATAVAIGDDGRIVHVQQPSPGRTLVKFSADSKRTIELEPAHGPVQCIALSPNGKHLVVGTQGGLALRLSAENGETDPVKLARSSAVSRVPVTRCAIGDDGAVAAGYYDGQVAFFAPDQRALMLTTRAIYGFPVPIKDVRIDPPGAHRRVTALGEWQINNCVHPGLPGQTMRAWDVGLPDSHRTTPVSAACFPNATIAALGAWGEKADDDTSKCPAPGNPSAGGDRPKPGLCLITPDGRRWHACPGCAAAGETADTVHARALDMAEKKGARKIDDAELEQRYGFKLGS